MNALVPQVRRHQIVRMRDHKLQAITLIETNREQPEGFRLIPWASRCRRDLLELLDRLNPTIGEVSAAIEQKAE